MKSRIALALGAGLVAATLTSVPAGPAQAAPATTTDGCIKSVPEPGSTEKVQICYTLFRPAGASRTDRVPFIMHSHGWGGSRTKDPARFQKWLDAGYGVLSFDQRGFGESGGKAHVENPDYEGHDVRRLIALIADLGWVRKDAPGDPRMGAIGGSYGGGYQFLGAFESLRLKGTPIFDALAPEITWYDLKESLGPEEVVRTEWALA
ncbi:MAG TPA: alpha/beta fold hydrolase, partial [Nocardioides sp.]|nr:alpha/beta fold hydrolase [Nocardioides sp.]